MQAIVQDTYGSAEVMHLRDIDTPEIDAHEVLVRVRAAGVNPADWAIMSGLPYIARPIYGLRKPKNIVRGTDVAGIVEAVGADVTRFRAGDEVFGWSNGSYAEFAAAAEDALALKPANITFEQAPPRSRWPRWSRSRPCAITATCSPGRRSSSTARRAVSARSRSRSPRRSGPRSPASAARGTSSSSAPSAPTTSSTTRRTTSPRTASSTTSSWTTSRTTRLRSSGAPSARPVRSCPTAATSGTAGSPVAAGCSSRTSSPRLAGQPIHPFLVSQNQADLIALKELIEAGKVTPVIDRTYPLDQTGLAIDHVGQGHARGKVAITV